MGFIFVSDSGQQMIVELTMTAVATKNHCQSKSKLSSGSCHVMTKHGHHRCHHGAFSMVGLEVVLSSLEMFLFSNKA